jgi:hypothetical protein
MADNLMADGLVLSEDLKKDIVFMNVAFMENITGAPSQPVVELEARKLVTSFTQMSVDRYQYLPLVVPSIL